MIAEDPFTETSLIATMHHEPMTYSSEDLFNDFLALGLQSMPTSMYPSPSDRAKIVAFLARYGPNFLPYPCQDRTEEDQLDYFSEFNRQYQIFAHAVGSLVKPLTPPPVLPPGHGSAPYDPVDNALTDLNYGLDQIKPRLRRLTDGTIVTTFEPTYGLYLCYTTLWEAMNSSNPPLGSVRSPPASVLSSRSVKIRPAAPVSTPPLTDNNSITTHASRTIPLQHQPLKVRDLRWP